MSVSTACTTRCRSTPFQRNVQRSAADLDQASLGSQACEEREREGGGGGGVKDSAHFALQILVIMLDKRESERERERERERELVSE